MPWTTPGTAVAGDVLTATRWNTDVRDNTAYLKTTTDSITASIQRLQYTTRTTAYTASATSVATAADIFSSDVTFTADGTSSYLVEVFFYEANTATSTGNFMQTYLVDGSGTSIALINTLAYGDGTRAAYAHIFSRFFYTPAAGSRSLNVRAIQSGSGNCTITCGTGASGAGLPGYIAVFGPPTT